MAAPAADGNAGRGYREIRSARYPSGFPDRSDETVLEAFDGLWLLIDHSPAGVELVGVADDYGVARAWLDQREGPAPEQASDEQASDQD